MAYPSVRYPQRGAIHHVGRWCLMARSYMNRSTAIWREDQFRSLTAEEQHVLFLIESQPDISAAGTLSLTLRRWAAMFQGGTIEGLRRTLAGLQVAGRVVVDEDAEELLLCTFVADDRGYRNSKRRPVILRAAAEVNSPAIRQALAKEFERLGMSSDGLAGPPDPGGPTPSARSDDDDPDQSGEVDREGEKPQWHEQSDTGVKPQVDNLSDRASDRASRFDGDVGCKALVVSSPTHIPHLSSRSPAPPPPTGLAALVGNALGIDDDETREVIDQIRRLHKPRNLAGYVRTMADNGDLTPVLDDVRRARARDAAIAERRAQRAALPDPASQPPESTATAEEAAAARAFMRNLAARGSGRGGEPMALGAVLGKAATA